MVFNKDRTRSRFTRSFTNLLISILVTRSFKLTIKFCELDSHFIVLDLHKGFPVIDELVMGQHQEHVSE